MNPFGIIAIESICVKNRRRGLMEHVMEHLLTIETAAEVLGISPWTVRAYIRDSKLHAVHIGRLVRIEQAEVRRFIEQAKADEEGA
jgi:excisionase family DNA binding protein